MPQHMKDRQVGSLARALVSAPALVPTVSCCGRRRGMEDDASGESDVRFNVDALIAQTRLYQTVPSVGSQKEREEG